MQPQNAQASPRIYPMHEVLAITPYTPIGGMTPLPSPLPIGTPSLKMDSISLSSPRDRKSARDKSPREKRSPREKSLREKTSPREKSPRGKRSPRSPREKFATPKKPDAWCATAERTQGIGMPSRSRPLPGMAQDLPVQTPNDRFITTPHIFGIASPLTPFPIPATPRGNSNPSSCCPSARTSVPNSPSTTLATIPKKAIKRPVTADRSRVTFDPSSFGPIPLPDSHRAERGNSHEHPDDMAAIMQCFSEAKRLPVTARRKRGVGFNRRAVSPPDSFGGDSHIHPDEMFDMRLFFEGARVSEFSSPRISDYTISHPHSSRVSVSMEANLSDTPHHSDLVGLVNKVSIDSAEDNTGTTSLADTNYSSKDRRTGTKEELMKSFSAVASLISDVVNSKEVTGRGDGSGQSGGRYAQGGMFNNADADLHEFRTNLGKKEYDVSDLYSDKGIFRDIAANVKFQYFTLGVIFVNSIWIGIEMDLNEQDSLFDAAWYFQLGEYSFFIFFAFEWFCRFMAFKRKIFGLRDFWFCFDSSLVSLMFVETFVLPIITKLGQSDDAGEGGGLGQFSLLRMARLLRLSRLVRLMRSVPELVTIIKGLSLAAKPVLSALLLLFILIYIFGIVFRSQLQLDKARDWYVDRSFSTLHGCMGKLLFQATFLDSIAKCANMLYDESPPMALIFVAFTLVSAFNVLNLLVGMLCNVVNITHEVEKEKALMSFFKGKLLNVLEELDEDGSGTIDREEFESIVQVPAAVKAINDLGVDVNNLVSLSGHLFDDENSMQRASEGSGEERINASGDSLGDFHRTSTKSRRSSDGKSLSFGEFIETVIRLRGNNVPSVIHFVELNRLLFQGQKDLNANLDKIEYTNAVVMEDVENTIACHPLLQAIGRSRLSVKRGREKISASGATDQHMKIMAQFRKMNGLRELDRKELRRTLAHSYGKGKTSEKVSFNNNQIRATAKADAKSKEINDFSFLSAEVERSDEKPAKNKNSRALAFAPVVVAHPFDAGRPLREATGSTRTSMDSTGNVQVMKRDQTFDDGWIEDVELVSTAESVSSAAVINAVLDENQNSHCTCRALF